jgi:hypothetical protein
MQQILGTFSHFAATSLLICALKPQFAAGSAPTNSVNEKVGISRSPLERMTYAASVKPTYCSTRTAQGNHGRTPSHERVCGRKMILLMAVARRTSYAGLATETGGHASCTKK